MPEMTKRAKDKVTLYAEVPPSVKADMEELAEQNNRSLAGEVVTALQRYIAQEKARAREEKGKGK